MATSLNLAHRFSRALRAGLPLVVVGSFAVAGARAQETLWSVSGSGDADRLGSSVASMADVDGDGVREVIVASSFFDFRNPTYRGTVWLLSGRDGHRLLAWQSPVGGSFGSAVSDAGDADGDSIHDVAIGDPDAPSGTDQVQVFSGADGHKIFGYQPTGRSVRAGASLAALADVDGDGHDDLLVGAPNANQMAGAVRLLSGADGSLLRMHAGDAVQDRFGGAVAAIADVDGDGFPDYVGGTAQGSLSAGYVRWFSGATGAVLRTTAAPAGLYGFGTGLADCGDVNQDGVHDLLAGAADTKSDPTFSFPNGALVVLSGSDASVLLTLFGETDGDFFGSSSAAVDDVNGDNLPDFVGGASGYCRLHSGRTGNALYRFEQAGAGGQTVALGDLDGDGIGDFALGHQTAGTHGEVVAVAGNDLFLNGGDNVAAAGETVEFATLEADPGLLTLRFLVEVDGTPLMIPLLPLATVGSDRRRFESMTVPPGLGPHHLVHVAVAQRAGGRGLVTSAPEVLDLE